MDAAKANQPIPFCDEPLGPRVSAQRSVKKLKKKNLPPKLQIWIDARKKYKLTHAQIQMAREIGMNPKSLGKLANHKQEIWKSPLPEYIEELYYKRFKKDKPDQVLTIEEIHRKKKEEKRSKSLEVPTNEDPF